MSDYGATQAIIERLRDIPILEDAVIAEEYTSPVTHRPVLTPVVSVGVKSMEMLPVSHEKHTANVVMRLTMLFPCGMTGEITKADIAYQTAAAFVGRKFCYLLVQKVTVEKTVFDTSMYGVGIELNLHMKGMFNLLDPMEETAESDYAIGNVTFDRFPESVTVKRQEASNTPMGSAPRVFTLTGSTGNGVGSVWWNSLHTLMHTSSALSLTLPRSAQTVSVKPTAIETEGDTCGYGFSFKLVFTEAI